ncbi:putative major facilitator superfamily transporter [Microlunatus phosphovorus NM-1]|uniref:Putative major facilitator superfamily transporter n=1 Tax=Microlunatus phosphovorus (strain ATCC 700054 / DSM 10555 / JCM 9379 / NBRC 101784 / NCIMB 13414 / VKM Ac-1990 / NM-1) TaxID=1032480 RepID=F5XQW9_MICPN|nr:MFS transporter [Microlunatus phosphovorus]BAK36991.1 putative major facilitator superfamily transporter [Microlunatus phosphovorus NM-1]
MTAQQTSTRRTAWSLVVGFGLVSLTADMVYEGARAITGPLLASLGATAAVVGLVSGLGEAVSLLLRLVSGSWADRSGRYWRWTIAGYAITAVSVPALAITPFLGAAGLVVGCLLIIAERFGKAVRSPAKSVLLAQASGVVGLGRGFGVHKALDQLGAFAGPLLVAAVISLTGALWSGLVVLAIPGALSIIVLLVLRRASNDTGTASNGPDSPTPGVVSNPSAMPIPSATPTAQPLPRHRLPSEFWTFAAAAGATTAGLVTFAVIGYHLVDGRVTSAALVPVIYAAAMAAAGVAALGTGFLFDRIHARVLLVLPLLVAAVPVFAFADALPLVMVGVLAWGAASGLQDSTVKALVADLVPAPRRGTAYGLFAAVQGGAAVLGGVIAGALYDHSTPALIAYVAATQLIALVLLVRTLRRPPVSPR